MKLLQWTLFIDMLGYRDINGSINSEDSAKEFVSFMEENKALFDFQNDDYFVERYKQDSQFDLYEFYEVKHAFVSDSLILTFYPKEVESLVNVDKMYMHSANALFIITMRLQAFIYSCFSQKGVFLRGGVSNKYCYVKDNFAVGEGLIDSYLVESKVAKYPRIALSKDTSSNTKLMEKIRFLSDVMYNNNQLVAKDPVDGVYYLDYLKYNLAMIDASSKIVQARILADRKGFDAQFESVELFVKKHGNGIEAKLAELNIRVAPLKGKEKEAMQKVIDKFEWLKDYHNSLVSKNNLVSEYTIK
ncbi:hypothetical protein R7036_22890 [Vibrio sp. 1637]|uniref:hypothetical protein n=1 Tax=Vibrio sp. 1637 TaxID=3074569 RepID=UPI00280E4191|nr:hypothetical protein [Vibrio sp. 1637]ELB2850165.1 hypothetical protein [Vibrio alginolyticus]ELK9268523.1 hypothetical protein [Vibrio alginolyticus]MDW2177989.1 hypothetical protein [Vibrio sp. 1637]